MARSAIIDTVSLGNLAMLVERAAETGLTLHGGVGNLLSPIFDEVHVPGEVKGELMRYGRPSLTLTQTVDAIDRNASVFRLCTTYDSMLLNLIRPPAIAGIDGGEAEAIAQSYKLAVGVFITDDVSCAVETGKRWSGLRCIETLAVLAALDLLGYLVNRDAILRLFMTSIHPSVQRERAVDLRRAYMDGANLLGVALPSRDYAQRIKLKRIFG